MLEEVAGEETKAEEREAAMPIGGRQKHDLHPPTASVVAEGEEVVPSVKGSSPPTEAERRVEE